MPRPGRTPPYASPGGGPGGSPNSGGSGSSPISQFRRSLQALKDLGITGIREGHGHSDPSIQEATEEQEMAQINALLQERSAARAEVGLYSC